jgi:murein DD-endopeptidase MepM/ murein hydrolase activator NlpD
MEKCAEHIPAVAYRAIGSLSAIAAAAAAVGIAMNSVICYAVYVDGAPVGTASSAAEAGVVIDGAERRLTEILGYNYALKPAVSVQPNLGVTSAAPDVLEDAILANVDEVELMYALDVGGKTAGAAESSTALTQILRGVLESYSTENTVSTVLIGSIAVTQRFVGSDVPRDAAEIAARLTPGSGSGAELTVRCVERVETDAALPFPVEYRYDGDVYIDEGGVIQNGMSGLARITSERVLVNGELVSETEKNNTVVREPVSQIVSVGTKTRPATASFGEYIMPADGNITSYFGYRVTNIGSSNHQGIDIAGKRGQDIRAADGGEVIYAGNKYSGYGNIIQILHDNGDVTYYAHCDKLLASEGERVARGQTIALMGRTGVASGVHCHFELRVDGVPVDPMKYLP